MNPIKMPYLVHQFLEYSAKRLPEKVALICGERHLTYKEINKKADRLAVALRDMGVQRQDRVAIFLDNSAESVIALFGILKAGAIFLMLSATMKAKKLNYILQDSGTRVLISHSNKARVIKDMLEVANDLDHIIWCSTKAPSFISQPTTLNPQTTKHSMLTEILSINSSCLRPTSGLDHKPFAHRCIDLDLATIIYTSGSTGDPKGVMSAHYNVISAARSITTYLENVENDIILNALPLSFDYGLYQLLMTFLVGGTLVLEKSFVYPVRVLEKIVQEKVTGFPLVPTMAAFILQMDLEKFDFSSLRYISNTAAALPISHILKLRKKFADVKIFSMYGLTECKRVSYLPPKEIDRRPESVGIPMPNEEVFIVNDCGQELGPDEIGELVVRGSNVMQGYWNSPTETAHRFRPGRNRSDTMLYTGDLFKKDEEGYLYFVARKDDLIKTKGERVSPKEIENTLCELDKVIEAAVIGVADDFYGQAIKAFVVVKEGSSLSKNQILKYCSQNMEPFMVPKYVEFRDSFPKSPSGKIDKKQLK
jgi:amino acid adenylation domain-containing protein